jgi:small nuclear ribonucleoprotein D1
VSHVINSDLTLASLFDISRGKNPVSFATLSVRGSTMRSWLLPESLNLDALLVDETPKKSVVPKPTTAPGAARGRGRGRGRGRR